jgi:elongation factor G
VARSALSPDERALAEPWRERLLETLAETDEAVLEAWLGGADLSQADIRAAIRRAVIGLRLVPVFAGSALKNIGVQPLLDGICDYLPSPLEVVPQSGLDPVTREPREVEVTPDGPLAALAFKVTLETGRKLVLMRLYSGKVEDGDVVLNVTRGVEERVARLFRLHAGRKEKVDRALAGEIVAAAGMKSARTGDSLTARERPLLLENIGAYRPVISLALEPRNTEESDRLKEALEKFLLEDPTLDLKSDEDTAQLVLSGMGELHLEVVLDRLRREHGLAPRSGRPQVVYQETVTARGAAEGEFDRELGETRHFGKVAVEVSPLPREGGREVVFAVDTAAFPAAWMDAVQQGLEDGLQSGVLKGYPVQDVRVTVTGIGRSEHSSAVGCHMAAASALKEALQAASPRLLEPIMWLEISVPDDFVGDALGLLGSKGAKVENMFDRAGQKVVQALAPLGRLFGFSTDLRSATQGRAGMMMKFSRFDILG